MTKKIKDKHMKVKNNRKWCSKQNSRIRRRNAYWAKLNQFIEVTEEELGKLEPIKQAA